MFVNPGYDGYARFRLTIAANVAQYNIRDELDALGYDGRPARVEVIVNSGVKVSGGTTSVASFETGNHHALTRLKLTNQGRIIGSGGRGGDGGNTVLGAGNPGSTGGMAIHLDHPLVLDNTSGEIWGGGGGGGGSGASGSYAGGGGGGGAGISAGGGGNGGFAGPGHNGDPGNAGTETTGGTGGANTNPGIGDPENFRGGTGGNIGVSGQSGQGGFTNGAGGQSGWSVARNGYLVNWIGGSLGDIRGRYTAQNYAITGNVPWTMTVQNRAPMQYAITADVTWTLTPASTMLYTAA